jgi:hypothetical protein
VAVEDDERHVGVGAAHRHLFRFVVVGTHRHARQALQRVGQVLVRHLAHVFGGDHLDVGGGVALDGQRLRHRGADTGHLDGLHGDAPTVAPSWASAGSAARPKAIATAAASGFCFNILTLLNSYPGQVFPCRAPSIDESEILG